MHFWCYNFIRFVVRGLDRGWCLNFFMHYTKYHFLWIERLQKLRLSCRCKHFKFSADVETCFSWRISCYISENCFPCITPKLCQYRIDSISSIPNLEPKVRYADLNVLLRIVAQTQLIICSMCLIFHCIIGF